MRVTVNVIFDFSMGALTHNTLLPPAIPAPTPSPSIEMIATQLWAAGFALKLNKLTMLVTHRGLGIVQEGHDCGPLIPDITPACPANAYYIVMWPMSSRKITFSASTVKMEKVAVGCAQTVGLPPLPMMTCGDPISAPTALVHPLQLLNSVTVGMTWGDFFLGLLTIGVAILIDAVFELLGGKADPSKRLKREILLELLSKTVGRDANTLAKRAVSAAAGFLISLLSGSPTFKPGLGGPFGGLEPSWSPQTGWTFPTGSAPAPVPAPAGGGGASGGGGTSGGGTRQALGPSGGSSGGPSGSPSFGEGMP